MNSGRTEFGPDYFFLHAAAKAALAEN